MNPPVIVAYYTPEYEPVYQQRLGPSRSALEASPGAFKWYVECRTACGDWRANAHIRPTFLQEMRLRFPDAPLLSLDADAELRTNPLPALMKLDCDLAFHTFRTVGTNKPEPLPGTLWLNPTVAVDGFLETWAALNAALPERNDRANFASALDSSRELRVAPLPPAYCYIFDLSRKQFPGVVPIIEHFQASRKMKKELTTKNTKGTKTSDLGPRTSELGTRNSEP